MVGVAVILAGATWIRFYLMMSIGERVIADLREAVFSHVLTLSPAFFRCFAHRRDRLAAHQRQRADTPGHRFRLSMFLATA